MILNHFRHNLLSSLENSFENHAKSNDNPILNEGLIMLIMQYAK